MVFLNEAQHNRVYQIKELQVEESVKRHLNELGVIPGGKIVLINTSGDNGIVLLHNSRIAITQSVLESIVVEEPAENPANWLSLDQLVTGESGRVVSIHGTGAVRRRLMDMGLTRGTSIYVRKLAPLGDPIEIHVRGYELTLRKSEAELVLIEKEENE
ncbi:ferrous iron transporter A [Enterococcus sp. JM4C]|uniref:FeoA family protein n=1 Tax=Candidatus Enterococcus huntleyi TaxID=1857217 RepID=UPI00137AD50D|nr:ferrous iron transport protein A [Enterococcus sp. JM4C]KAF1299574.1 ferrous iron transporter A [Enterococcus sp. JM4C]